MKTGQLMAYGRGALFHHNPFEIDDEIKRWRKGKREKQHYEYSVPAFSSSQHAPKQVLVKAIWHHKYQKPDASGNTSESLKVFRYLSDDAKCMLQKDQEPDHKELQADQEQTEFDYYSKNNKAFSLVGEHGQRLSGEEFRELGRSWDHKNQGEDGRTAAHLIFSLNEIPTAKNCLIVENAVQRIHNYYADAGYDCAFAVHQDTQNAHAHLVIRARNQQTSKKLRLSKAELFFLRQEFAQSVKKSGLNYCATKSNSPEYQDYMQEKSDQNYLKSMARRDYGEVAEKLIKKSFIEQHDEGKAGVQAKTNLKNFRQVLKGDEEAKQAFQDSLASYAKLLEKYETKKALQEKWSHLNPRYIDMTVDYAFAVESKALKQARSQDVPSLEKLRTAKAFKERLVFLAHTQAGDDLIAQSIQDFGTRQDENKTLANHIKQPNPYGESGLVYMQEQVKWFQRSNDSSQRNRIKQTIESVQSGQMPQEKLDRYVFELLKQQEQKDQFLAERKAFYRKRIAQNSGVPLDQIEQVDLIFEKYFLQKNQNRFQAAHQFFYTLQNYEQALIDPKKLQKFVYALNNQKTVQNSQEIQR